MAAVRVYIACSLDGFIAGQDDDLSWLPGADGRAFHPSGEGVSYEAFTAGIGSMLMGRRTYDAVAGFDIDWPYGTLPVLVATHRALEEPPGTVRPIAGTIHDLVEQARGVAGEKDVYLDGGEMIRQALDADLIDDLIITLVPTVLGSGQPLFAGAQRHDLELVDQCHFGSGLVQLRLRPTSRA